ncbi:flagellar basal body rod protein FlgB [Hoeflea sp. TYP-13]|uniref:flagellar basal body rod protein FlgB n=1 Tax=Hoeflea sp. TYP-13 TaxID=3230023 RepID=UPI0034C6B2A5
MQPIQLFELASSKAHWLSVRQNVVTGNIANANTPGYVTMEIDPFETVLQSVGTSMSATHPMHFTEDSMRGAVRADGGDVAVSPSGNSVALEEELMKAGEVRQEYELNAGILRSFHRMMLMTVRK